MERAGFGRQYAQHCRHDESESADGTTTAEFGFSRRRQEQQQPWRQQRVTIVRSPCPTDYPCSTTSSELSEEEEASLSAPPAAFDSTFGRLRVEQCVEQSRSGSLSSPTALQRHLYSAAGGLLSPPVDHYYHQQPDGYDYRQRRRIVSNRDYLAPDRRSSASPLNTDSSKFERVPARLTRSSELVDRQQQQEIAAGQQQQRRRLPPTPLQQQQPFYEVEQQQFLVEDENERSPSLTTRTNTNTNTKTALTRRKSSGRRLPAPPAQLRETNEERERRRVSDLSTTTTASSVVSSPLPDVFFEPPRATSSVLSPPPAAELDEHHSIRKANGIVDNELVHSPSGSLTSFTSFGSSQQPNSPSVAVAGSGAPTSPRPASGFFARAKLPAPPSSSSMSSWQLPPTIPQSPRTSVFGDRPSSHMDLTAKGSSTPVQRTRKLTDASLDCAAGVQGVFASGESDQFSSLSPSMEQISSVRSANSDNEDPAAYGIDPNLYKDEAGGELAAPPRTEETPNGEVDHSFDDRTITIARDSEVKSSGLGVLHYSIQYFPVRKRLRVNIVKADGLAGQLRPDLELNAYAKICLSPGDAQKQQSRIVKRTRDIIFGEEFFFDSIAASDLKLKTVHIQLCHHMGQKFQKDVVIGIIDINLTTYEQQLSSKKELKLTNDLRPKINTKKLGKLQISTCLEKESRRLTVNIVKADGLPKYGISGPPDPCIRIEFEQNGRRQTKQSRTLKNCRTAVYREAVMFLVQSTKVHDLKQNTSLTISVVDTARTAAGSDDLIGMVYLGALAVDKSEVEQWRCTVDNSNKEYKATHALKLPNQRQQQQQQQPFSEEEDDEQSELNDTFPL